MADKRASANIRPAVPLPRAASPQISQTLGNDTVIARTIGAKVKITTNSNPSKSYEGFLFSAHTASGLLTLTPSYPPASNTTPALTVLPIASVQSLSILTPSATSSQTNPKTQPQPSTSLPALPPALDEATRNSRLQAAVARARQEEAKRGKGVSKDAQDIFDAVSRTLPTEWDGENILVLGQVLILKPYRVEDVKGIKDAQASIVQRIRKVLDIERKKLAEKSAVNGPRKGG